MKDVEQCWLLYGINIGQFYVGYLKYHSEGTPASVVFDWHTGLSRFLLGWYHTHVNGSAIPSGTDNRTFRGWVKSINKPFLCGIIGIDGQKCYKYIKGGIKRKTSVIYRSVLRSTVCCNLFFAMRSNVEEWKVV